MLVYGGMGGSNFTKRRYSDLWAYYPETNRWRMLAPQGSGPRAYVRHSLSWIPSLEKAMLHGGDLFLEYRAGEQEQVRNDVWFFDPGTNAWEPGPLNDGDVPHLSGHAGVWNPIQENLVFVGGLSDTYAPSFGLYDPLENTWTEVQQMRVSGLSQSQLTKRAPVYRGSIYGQVVDNEGNPVGNIGVSAFPAYMEPSNNHTCTDPETGKFFIHSVKKGEYILYAGVEDWCPEVEGIFGWEWFPEAILHEGAKTIDIDLPHMDEGAFTFSLDSGAQISGRVSIEDSSWEGSIPVVAKDANGRPLAHTCVEPAEETYTISGLPYHTYYVSLGGNHCKDSELGVKYWPGVSDIDDATPITLSSTTPQASEVNFEVQTSGAISGAVHDIRGNPIPGIGVAFHYEGRHSSLLYTCTDSDGNYELSGLEFGRYKVVAGPPICGERGYRERWWPKAPNMSSGDWVVVSSEAPVAEDIDFGLPARSR